MRQEDLLISVLQAPLMPVGPKVRAKRDASTKRLR
ncbi:hypothetical protein MFUL124B02_13860 [Myxococcus fulvus 124B02]|nr:hypothetical protein MFUL124B02_13860 [Myxococcus fulvus 124B02]